MDKEEYYELMETITPKIGFEELHKNWLDCFTYVLTAFKVGFVKESIESLFYHFSMENWKTIHQENTVYKGYSKNKLIKKFCAECSYVSDRMSYDRLFRTHWLFLRAFDKEILKLKYPSLYGK